MSKLAEAAPVAIEPTARSSPARRFLVLLERYALILIWIVLFFVFVAINPALFLQRSVVSGIFSSADVYVLLGLAALLPFYVGEFDLSIAFSMGLSATVLPVLFSTHGVPIAGALVVALLAAALVGLVNGFIVVRLGVDALITTLGVGTVVLGGSMAISNEQPVGGLPGWLAAIATQKVLGLTATFWYGVVILLVLAYVLYATPLGRKMTFVGSSREVSRLAGIPVNRIRYGSYIGGHAIAGIAGILLAAKLGGFDSPAATAYMLPTFSVIFVSASAITLGRFNPFGVLIAACFIATGSLGLQLLGLSGWSQQVFYGSSLVVAVTLVNWLSTRRKA